MRERTHNLHPIAGRRLLAGLLFSLLLSQAAMLSTAQAESLFRASTTYRAETPSTYRSLFTPPIARQVGDTVTILIDETAQTQDKAELKIDRERMMDSEGSSPYNQLMTFVLGKFDFTKRFIEPLSAPSFSNNTSGNSITSKAENIRTTTLKDSITCQVVQVMPNGDLMVQGQKTVQMNKERQDIIITGIVRPYYLDRNNQISSAQVANMQLIRGGRGVISRQQNDGIANKIYQFFN